VFEYTPSEPVGLGRLREHEEGELTLTVTLAD
jgi:hypothetical protein